MVKCQTNSHVMYEREREGALCDALFKETITHAFSQEDISSFGFT